MAPLFPRSKSLLALVMAVACLSSCSRPSFAFTVTNHHRRLSGGGLSPSSSSSPSSTRLYEMEQIEFKIFPDGRVEETVRGVKGNNCHKVTEQINEALGKVVATEATEELYEQELVVEQTITETIGESSSSSSNGGDSSSSWEGQSTW